MTVSALVLLPREADKKVAPRFTGAPLAALFHTVYEASAGNIQTTELGQAEWQELPVEELLTEGLWPVIVRVGEKMGITTLTSPRDILTTVIPVAHRLISQGLLLRYATVEEAAKDLLNALRQSHAAASMYKTRTPLMEVAGSVSMFFGGLIKLTQETRKEILQAKERIQRKQRVCLSIGGKSIVRGHYNRLHVDSRERDIIALSFEPIAHEFEYAYTAHLAQKEMRAIETTLSLVTPILESTQFPSTVSIDHISDLPRALFTTWTMLAACGDLESAWIDQASFKKARAQIRRAENERLIENNVLLRFARQLRRPVTAQERTVICDNVRAAIGWVRSLGYDDLVPSEVFCLIASLEHVRFVADTLNRHLLCREDAERTLEKKLTPEQRLEILKLFNWKQLLGDEYISLLYSHSYTMQDILRYYEKLQKSVQKDIKDRVRSTVLEAKPGTLNQQTIENLVRLGVVTHEDLDDPKPSKTRKTTRRRA